MDKRDFRVKSQRSGYLAKFLRCNFLCPQNINLVKIGFAKKGPSLLRSYPIKGPDHPLIEFLFETLLLRLCPLKEEREETEFLWSLIRLVTHIKAFSRGLVLLNVSSALLRHGDNPAKIVPELLK